MSNLVNRWITSSKITNPDPNAPSTEREEVPNQKPNVPEGPSVKPLLDL